ncbi:MAG TPA: hypothetical protein VGY99_10550 [Candidatus Binataceae bacterium]|jgi:hypothetical protein|nr:hypothetical protein [Candidatus Binataceae bacterium]
MDLLSAIAALLLTKLGEEVHAGFPNLSRIPSTGAIKFLDHFASLTPAERGPLLEVMARLGAMQFFPIQQISAEHERLRTNDPAYTKFWAAMQSPAFGYGLRYCDLKMARMMLNDRQSLDAMAKMRSTLGWQPRDDPPKELVSDPDLRRVQPAKAPLLRKLVKGALTELLSAKRTKVAGGEMVYSGSLENRPLAVSVDFGSRLGQLRYGVKAAIPERNLRVFQLTYEVFWGANLGWDYLTEENVARSIDLFCDRLRFLMRLIEQIAALPLDDG